MGAASLHNEAHANRPVHIYIYIVDSGYFVSSLDVQ